MRVKTGRNYRKNNCHLPLQINEDKTPNYGKFQEEIEAMEITETLKKDFLMAVDMCQKFSQCLPVERVKHPFMQEMGTTMGFMKCCGMKRVCLIFASSCILLLFISCSRIPTRAHKDTRTHTNNNKCFTMNHVMNHRFFLSSLNLLLRLFQMTMCMREDFRKYASESGYEGDVEELINLMMVNVPEDVEGLFESLSM